MNTNVQKQMAFEANRKSVGIAYLLWILLGGFGVHRFYAGATKTGIAQLLLAISIIGWVVLVPWLIADLFLIPGLVRERNLETMQLLSLAEAEEPHESRPRPKTVSDRKREAMLEDLRSTGYRKDRRDNSYLYR